MTYAELVDRLQLDYPQIETGKLFSMPCLKLAGKAIGGDWRGDFVAKLSPDDAERALKIAGAEQFSPAAGHMMKQWIVVPQAQSATWPELAEQAVAYRIDQMGVIDGK